MNPKYLHPGLEFARNHVISEMGEVGHALGKLGQWGPLSFNPELPVEQRETNISAVWRELQDLKGAIARYEAAILADDISRSGLPTPTPEAK